MTLAATAEATITATTTHNITPNIYFDSELSSAVRLNPNRFFYEITLPTSPPASLSSPELRVSPPLVLACCRSAACSAASRLSAMSDTLSSPSPAYNRFTVESDASTGHNGNASNAAEDAMPPSAPKIGWLRRMRNLNADQNLCHLISFIFSACFVVLLLTLVVFSLIGIFPTRSLPLSLPPPPPRVSSAAPSVPVLVKFQNESEPNNESRSNNSSRSEYTSKPSTASPDRTARLLSINMTSIPLAAAAAAASADDDVSPSSFACGRRFQAAAMAAAERAVVDSRIIGGIPVVPHSQPWMVSLRIVNADGSLGAHRCGGALITQQHVLTAAHCVSGSFAATDFAVLLALDRLNVYDATNAFAVARVFVNEAYTGELSVQGNDLAVLKLSGRVPLSTLAFPICLPPANDNDDTLVFEANAAPIVSGWGSVSPTDSGALADTLQSTRLDLIDRNPYCTLFGPWDTDRLFCGIRSDLTANVCFGDSGGPLAMPINDTWFLYGVASFVLGDAVERLCDTRRPSYFTRVSVYRSWIVGKLSL